VPPPPPQRKEKDKKKREKKRQAGAAITFGEMFICMVATPVKAMYNYCSNVFGCTLRTCFQPVL
jgi:hypothetical protein